MEGRGEGAAWLERGVPPLSPGVGDALACEGPAVVESAGAAVPSGKSFFFFCEIR